MNETSRINPAANVGDSGHNAVDSARPSSRWTRGRPIAALHSNGGSSLLKAGPRNRRCPTSAATTQVSVEGATHDDEKTTSAPPPGLSGLWRRISCLDGVSGREQLHLPVRRPVLCPRHLRVHQPAGRRSAICLLRHGAQQYLLDVPRRRLPGRHERTGCTRASRHRCRECLQKQPRARIAERGTPLTVTGRSTGQLSVAPIAVPGNQPLHRRP